MPSHAPDTVQEIIDAARRLFAQQAYDSVKMEDVAKEAKVGKPTVYRHFKDKESLYLQMLEQIGTEFLALLRKADESAQKCRDRLVAIVDVTLSFFTKHSYLLNLLDRAKLDRGKNEKKPWDEVQRQLFLMLQGLLAKGVVRGEFIVDDIELGMLALIGAMRYQIEYPCKELESHLVPERLVNMVARPTSGYPQSRAAAA